MKRRKGLPKPRKPRGIKLNGRPSYNMCPTCYMPGCDPFGGSNKYRQKVYKRLQDGKCPACGQSQCQCKSTMLRPDAWLERESERIAFYKDQ